MERWPRLFDSNRASGQIISDTYATMTVLVLRLPPNDITQSPPDIVLGRCRLASYTELAGV